MLLSWGLILLGVAAFTAGLVQRLALDVERPRRWTDAWAAWLLRGVVFLLAGLAGFAPSPWKLLLLLGALSLTAASAVVDRRWARRARGVPRLDS